MAYQNSPELGIVLAYSGILGPLRDPRRPSLGARTGMIDIEAGLATVLTDHREEILEIAARHGAHNVRVFGSAARGSDTSSSDVDLLVDLDRGRSLFDLTSLIRELQVALERDVDVVTEDGLYWLIRRRILSEARPL